MLRYFFSKYINYKQGDFPTTEKATILVATYFTERLIDRGVPRVSPTAAFLAVALPLCLWIVWSAFWFPLFTYAPHEDVWEHIAAINEWKTNLAAPGNPHLAVEAGSPRYMPFFFALTVLAIALDLTALQAMQVGAVLNTILLLAGIYLFFGTYFRNPWAPVVGLLVMLGFWGLGWRTSNEYELRSLFYVASYPSMFAFALSLMTLSATIKALRRTAPWLVTCLVVLLAFAVTMPTHALTAAFCLAGIGCLCVTERAGALKDRALLLVAAVVGILASELWPYFSTIRFIIDPAGGVETWVSTATEQHQAASEVGSLGTLERVRELIGEHGFYNGWKVALALGPALLGLPCLIYLALRRRHAFILLGFGAMMVPYLAFLLVPVPLAFRFLLYGVFFLHVALVAALLEDLPRLIGIGGSERPAVRTRLLGWAIALAVPGLFLGHAALAAGFFAYNHVTKEPVTAVMARITPHIQADSVVLASTRLSWPLPAFKGKVVGLLHGNPMVPDQHARFQAVNRFFEEPMPFAERRDILDRYGVTHVLVELATAPSGLMTFLRSRGTRIATVEGYPAELKRDKRSLAAAMARPKHRIAIFLIQG